MIKKIVFIILIVLVFSLSIWVGLKVGKCYRWKHRGKEPAIDTKLARYPVKRLGRFLGLSLEQRNELLPLYAAFFQDMGRVRIELRNKRRELVGELSKSESSKDKAMAKVREIASLQGEMQNKVIDFIYETRDILTPEQRVKFYSLLAKKLHLR